MGAAGLQPQPDEEVRFSVRVAPERLAKFDELWRRDRINAVMRALEAKQLQRKTESEVMPSA